MFLSDSRRSSGQGSPLMAIEWLTSNPRAEQIGSTSQLASPFFSLRRSVLSAHAAISRTYDRVLRGLRTTFLAGNKDPGPNVSSVEGLRS
jgi:hypothetical protein